MSELIAVTGAEGFIGSHLVEALVVKGNRVRARKVDRGDLLPGGS